MKISWNWTEDDKRDFPQVETDREELSVDAAQYDTWEDLAWRIATEIYDRYGIVVTSGKSLESHVGNFAQLKEMFNRR